MIGCSAQYLDESALIGTNSTYSIMQFLGVELWQWRHHGNNQVFKATTQFALQIRYQVLKALTRTTNVNERINDITQLLYNVTIRQRNQENCNENKTCYK